MKLGLAFSGGGVKGAAHIGVLKALLENNIKIDVVAGTSAGSIVAAMYALGYTPEEMLKLFKYFSKDMLKPNAQEMITRVKNNKSIRLEGAFSSINIELAMKEIARYNI